MRLRELRMVMRHQGLQLSGAERTDDEDRNAHTGHARDGCADFERAVHRGGGGARCHARGDLRRPTVVGVGPRAASLAVDRFPLLSQVRILDLSVGVSLLNNLFFVALAYGFGRKHHRSPRERSRVFEQKTAAAGTYWVYRPKILPA